jgi:hypothetical protein
VIKLRADCMFNSVYAERATVLHAAAGCSCMQIWLRASETAMQLQQHRRHSVFKSKPCVNGGDVCGWGFRSPGFAHAHAGSVVAQLCSALTCAHWNFAGLTLIAMILILCYHNNKIVENIHLKLMYLILVMYPCLYPSPCRDSIMVTPPCEPSRGVHRAGISRIHFWPLALYHRRSTQASTKRGQAP